MLSTMWWVLEARAYAPNIMGRLLGTFFPSFPILQGRLRHGLQIASRRNYTSSSIHQTKVCMCLLDYMHNMQQFALLYKSVLCPLHWACKPSNVLSVVLKINKNCQNIIIQVSLFCHLQLMKYNTNNHKRQ